MLPIHSFFLNLKLVILPLLICNFFFLIVLLLECSHLQATDLVLEIVVIFLFFPALKHLLHKLLQLLIDNLLSLPSATHIYNL
jgi:hypothetical protein